MRQQRRRGGGRGGGGGGGGGGGAHQPSTWDSNWGGSRGHLSEEDEKVLLACRREEEEDEEEAECASHKRRIKDETAATKSSARSQKFSANLHTAVPSFVVKLAALWCRAQTFSPLFLIFLGDPGNLSGAKTWSFSSFTTEMWLIMEEWKLFDL